jgi:hypothetical protein
MVPKSILKRWFLRMSEPLQAVRENNLELISRYYGSMEAFMRLYKREEKLVFGG